MSQRRITYVLHPAELVRILMGDRSSFEVIYGDTQFLLVCLPEGSDELGEGLATAACKDEHTAETKPGPPIINFNTEILSHVALARSVRSGGKQGQFDEVALSQQLANCAHFIVPLRKRLGADMLYVDRISVGRARNKDVVLRHASVSKFHGWFQRDDAGRYCFVDAGSKNKTRLNGKVLAPRELAHLESGDRIKLGSVDVMVSAADTLWAAAHDPTTHGRPDNLVGW